MTEPTFGTNEEEPEKPRAGDESSTDAASAHAPSDDAGAGSAERGNDAPDVAPAAEQAGDAETGDAEDTVDAETGDAAAGAPADPVAAAQAERDEYLELLRRERAEFENYRKRVSKEQGEALDRGAEQVCSELLLVLDNFDYTRQAAEGSSDDQLAKGVEMVHRQLLETLERVGLEAVPGQGATFDPTVHEAVAQVDAEQELGEAVDEPVVVEVMRPGYRFKDRLLRPASVKVAK